MEGNEESPDVIIDSYMEVTKSIPDVGVKLEVAEDNAQQLPFIPDSSAEAERQEREQQQHPTPPHFTPVMSGSGTSVDPVTVDGTKDLFDSGILLSINIKHKFIVRIYKKMQSFTRSHS